MVIREPDISKFNKNILFLENKLKRDINPVIYSFDEYLENKIQNIQFILDILKNLKLY